MSNLNAMNTPVAWRSNNGSFEEVTKKTTITRRVAQVCMCSSRTWTTTIVISVMQHEFLRFTYSINPWASMMDSCSSALEFAWQHLYSNTLMIQGVYSYMYAYVYGRMCMYGYTHIQDQHKLFKKWFRCILAILLTEAIAQSVIVPHCHWAECGCRPTTSTGPVLFCTYGIPRFDS